MRQKYSEYIEMILNNFPFGKVQEFMQANNWQFQATGRPATIAEMKDVVREMLRDTVNKEFGWTSLGFETDIKEGGLSLTFPALGLKMDTRYEVPTVLTGGHRNGRN